MVYSLRLGRSLLIGSIDGSATRGKQPYGQYYELTVMINFPLGVVY